MELLTLTGKILSWEEKHTAGTASAQPRMFISMTLLTGIAKPKDGDPFNIERSVTIWDKRVIDTILEAATKFGTGALTISVTGRPAVESYISNQSGNAVGLLKMASADSVLIIESLMDASLLSEPLPQAGYVPQAASAPLVNTVPQAPAPVAAPPVQSNLPFSDPFTQNLPLPQAQVFTPPVNHNVVPPTPAPAPVGMPTAPINPNTF